ncbi:hypothetical protein EZ456_09945 [Pedobacter psychrodurus]|uniref:Uncharacterized protein n=1 Tax=Pedobacter psychrodurus TaxID=2530456 RepID=A0A4R0PXF6_9SPHI|nr:hypothetical protein [Pedobacter psychrodurus]TCD27503.1 hypothetical protein EZ456_09945 [Pedobacter psychrodurus]
MINNARNLKKRLLGLFPAKTLKENFNEDGNISDVIEILSGNLTDQAVYNFVRNHHTITRQHIYFYNLLRNFNPLSMIDFPFEIFSQSANAGTYEYLILPEISYRVVLSNPLEQEEVKFLQPVMIQIKNQILTLHFTKLEKNVAPYFDTERIATKVSQTNSEQEILNTISEFFINAFGLQKLDINRGVKFLWDTDSIDSTKVQWRRDSSVATDTMDENLLFKANYRVDYDVLILKPLVKTFFKYIKDDEYFCTSFDVDPANGQLNIPRFPKNVNQVKNVITEILANN